MAAIKEVIKEVNPKQRKKMAPAAGVHVMTKTRNVNHGPMVANVIKILSG
jgi:hypothetical protein